MIREKGFKMTQRMSSYILNVENNKANLKYDGNEFSGTIQNIQIDIGLQDREVDLGLTNTQMVMTTKSTKKTTITLEFFEHIEVKSNSNGKFKITTK